ncbi:cytochrome b/b6 domain-containing protein [Glutamicibacter sp.]|uniref:cytochrome b/b6 domain-containing protein n=1 Tax=Glutamicibacter sp. TaxID=1931995 RepID=UPI002B45ADB5|nr:cytochrome b/b6 domain-containing protein [Glutamicibacter sp.]HJX78482.1 cytochrome b/b6 domain-containing protein [Glutamicibacter sp.]
MTKQRMAGYTPLRTKGGVQPEAPASAKETHTTQPVAAEPTEAPVAPVQATPAAVAEPVQKAVPAEAPAPVVPAAPAAETKPAAAAREVSPPETGSTSTRQRMAGYTPLRLRDGVASNVAATTLVGAAAATTTSVPAEAATAEAAPASVHAPATASSDSESAPAAAVTATPVAKAPAIPANRMKGYTPLRAPDSATESAAAAADLATEESSRTPQAAESVSKPAAVASTDTEQPETSQEATAVKPVAEPVAEEAPAPQIPDKAANTAAPVTHSESPAAAKPATAPGTGAKQEVSSIKMKPWVKPAVLIFGAVLAALLVVLAARGLRLLGPVQDFIGTYDGHSTLPDSAPTGIPGWLGWQHFLNMFFIVLIIRTGLQVRHEKRPAAMWTPKPNSWFSPKGNSPKKYSLSIWTHQVLDVLWVANGVIFVILLAATGQWMRVVPTSWDIFPNMLSGALQYASLNWPVEDGWIHYNALQMVSYFLVIYIAAPLAILTGVRMSSWWPTQPKALNKFYPVEVARRIHFPVMLFFSAFIVVHVFLVLTTGALKNLNHMYSSRDATDAWGLVIFLVSVAVIAAAWIFMKPMFLLPVASATGKVSKN